MRNILLIALTMVALGACEYDTSPLPSDDPEDPEPITNHMGALFLHVEVPGVFAGAFAEVTFMGQEGRAAPIWKEGPGLFGCEVYEYGPEDFVANIIDMECTHFAGHQDQGVFTFEVDGGPEIPPCVFVEGQGYRCLGATGVAAMIEPIDPTQAVYALRDPGATFGAEEIGRFIHLSGATLAANNGTFPIVDASGDTLMILNPQHDPSRCAATPADCTEASGSAGYVTIAGLPGGLTPPIPDDATVTLGLESGGRGEVPSFSVSVDMGDSFTLDRQSTDRLWDVPMDGSPFRLGCAGEGGDCGHATLSGLTIVATDAPINPSLPPLAVPPPISRAIQISCLSPYPTIDVPAEAAAYLADLDATRVRTIFMRINERAFPSAGVSHQIGVGHATVGTNPE